MRAFDRALQLCNLKYRAGLMIPLPKSTPDELTSVCIDMGCTIENDIDLQVELLANQGSLSNVYRTIIAGQKRIVKIPNEKTTTDAIRRELMLAHCDHPNIIRVFGCVSDTKELHGILLENGGENDLYDVVDKSNGGLEDEILLDYTSQILAAVHYLHSNGIMHLDIKLENILVDGPDQRSLKLCDFGLAHSDSWRVDNRCFGSLAVGAKWNEEEETCPRDISTLFGSPGYLPHYKLATNPNFVNKRDQWAVGITVFIMAYGIMPYEKPLTSDKAYAALLNRSRHFENFSLTFGIEGRIVEPLLHLLINKRPLSDLEPVSTLEKLRTVLALPPADPPAKRPKVDPAPAAKLFDLNTLPNARVA